MKEAGRAILAGIKAPLSHWRLALLLWLARIVPIFLFFTLPFFARADASLSHHPDARTLLDAPADESGFAFAWTSDFFRDGGGTSDIIFYLVLGTWFFVTVFAGGITARLVHGRTGMFLAECGRYAGRFLRLGVVALIVYYALDVAVNSVLSEKHGEIAKLQHTQDFTLDAVRLRAMLYLGGLYLFGMLHSYARIDIVLRERRSSVLAYLRAAWTLIRRLPKLLVMEVGMVLVLGLGVLLAWVLMRAGRVGPEATSASLFLFVGLAALASYIRTGFELGIVVARCRILVPPKPAAPSRIETPPAPPEEDADEYELSPDYPPS